MRNTIEGTWRSRYEYGQGTDDTPKTSEHQIEFTQEDGAWSLECVTS